MSIEVKNLSFSYGEKEVLKDVSFTAEYGQFLSVLGPNGVGKSTLFRCMLGILKPTAGGTIIDGKSTADMTASQLSHHMAYIPQSHNPVFNYSVFDMVLMGATGKMGNFSTPGKEQIRAAENALARLGITHLRDRGYANISGGERQLALIARALVQDARILIMDEPSSALDYGNRMRVMQTVKSLTKEGYTVIQSTHDPDQAFLYSDRVLAIHGGRVLAYGDPKETICDKLISTLYGVEVEVCSLYEDRMRVCVPANIVRDRE